MSPRLFPATVALLALAFASGGAFAQGKQKQAPATNARQMVPVLNKANGKLEAVLMLEPTANGGRWRWGNTSLDATLGLRTGNALALLCDRRQGSGAPAMTQLANDCVLATLGNDPGKSSGTSQHTSVGLALTRPDGRLGLSFGNGRDTLPAWLTPGAWGATRYNQRDVSLFAEKSLGNLGYVSVGGAVARARLVPATEVPQLADQWNSRSLSIGGGYGNFSANVIGRVVNVPGESDVWKGLGLGLTWRTPWNGQLSIGADNVITRGRNPLTPAGINSDEGTVPYVRYQQDL
jgi:hypothetical protein